MAVGIRVTPLYPNSFQIGLQIKAFSPAWLLNLYTNELIKKIDSCTNKSVNL
jgi:hypothetical protein